MPKRHQRTRKKGAKLRPGVTCVTRPGRWGNPYPSAHDFRCAFLAIKDAQPLHPRLESGREHIERIVRDIKLLKGFDLACWCPIGSPCHADTLLEFANK